MQERHADHFRRTRVHAAEAADPGSGQLAGPAGYGESWSGNHADEASNSEPTPDHGSFDSAAGGDPEADPAAVAKAIVYRQLAAAPKSRLQLARKLAERHVPEDVAEAVLDKFEAVRLIDDAEFAQMWVRSRASSRKLAKGALRRELAEKGIEQDAAEDALAQVSDADEEAAAYALVERKFRPGADLSDRAERDKVTRRLASMLARKGYQPALAFRIVGDVLAAHQASYAGELENGYPE